MEVELLFLIGTLKNVTTSFYDATLTGLALKISSIIFTTKVGVFWYMFFVNYITNSSRLNFQMITTNYCYQLLLKHFTESRNLTTPGFGEGV